VASLVLAIFGISATPATHSHFMQAMSDPARLNELLDQERKAKERYDRLRFVVDDPVVLEAARKLYVEAAAAREACERR
jgi:hypothetical protein